MKRTNIKEIGTINVESLNIAEGVIEMRMPIEATNSEFGSKLDIIFDYFKKQHTEVASENIFYEARMVITINRCEPEISLTLIVFDAKHQEVAEIWDELEMTISDDTKKKIRKVMWDKLGETL